MPSDNQFISALKKQGAADLLVLAIGGFMFVSFICSMIFGFGDPEIKKLRDRCHDRETYRIGRPGVGLSDDEVRYVVRRCEREVREYRDKRR
jgi:hypothetical protein